MALSGVAGDFSLVVLVNVLTCCGASALVALDVLTGVDCFDALVGADVGFGFLSVDAVWCRGFVLESTAGEGVGVPRGDTAVVLVYM